MKLDDFFNFLTKLPVDDYIVRLEYKYDHEKEYHYSNELLLCDGSDYYWNNDWNEGQQYVEVLGYMPLSQVETFRFPVPNAQAYSKCEYCHHLIFRDYKHKEGLCNLTRLHRCFYDRCVHEEEMS